VAEMDARKAEILRQIDGAHEQWDAVEFWPQQFTEAGFGTFEEVLDLLRQLADDGYLKERVVVKSVDGHSFYEGPPRGVPAPHEIATKFYFVHGREPDLDGDDAEVLLLDFFVISPAHLGALDQKKNRRTETSRPL
jgi:hypothetical protein